jgi:CHAT domain-containing protein
MEGFMDDLTILNEIHKGVTMGMSSLEDVAKKSSDSNFKDELTTQFTTYQTTLNKVNNEFANIGEIPDDAPLNEKVMGWTGIQMNTISDTSNSKLSEILIQGYDMGVIKGFKLLNQNPKASQNVKNILNGFIRLQENNINRLKKFL